MASPTVRRSTNRSQSMLPSWRFKRLPLLPRRCGAWLIEVSLVVASAWVPFSLGEYAKLHSASEPVPLNPFVAQAEAAIARTLAIPVGDRDRTVPPLTNLLWSGAVVAPFVVAGLNLYSLTKTGKTQPKRWFAVKVVTATGAPPGLVRAVVREGIGRWGLPLGLAYTIWRYSGAFPDLSILLGLASFLVLGENFSARFNARRWAWHDRLSRTTVIDAAQPTSIYSDHVQVLRRDHQAWSEQSSQWSEEDAAIAAIVLTPEKGWRGQGLWYWMRQHPGMTLLIVSLSSIALVLGTFVGTQVYVQSQANRREFKQQDNQVFLALVSKLTPTSPGAPDERQGAILALGTVNDSRAVPLLVDLLGQEDKPALIDAIQQALVSSGPDALPYLQRLNQSLKTDLESLRYGNNEKEYKLLALRRRATQRAIAKLLTIYSGQVHAADLNRVDLGRVAEGAAQFTLVLDQIDLSGVQLKSAILAGASLQGSRFYGAGEDERWGTFDDWVTDLSGAELKDANLTGAFLGNALMERTNLIRAILNKADLSKARLSKSNLSSAKLVAANFRQAILNHASLTGADLGNADFSEANLQAARLGQASATATKFQLANLVRSEWQGADLTGSDFSQANLQYADLSSTQLGEANFKNAQLQHVSFRNADLNQADLRGANVTGADFQGAIFTPSSSKPSSQFIQLAPSVSQSGLFKGANFVDAKNLNPTQIAYICAQGGRHSQCQ
ncbi:MULTISPECIES: pentapeptide repeat-containing protein [Trichocoleus]|uniref:Pentapeptide repeat-containing protein n=1 Tax=Trichocoleus desertorum GB2-A4 TaxID=2933944 RepID=A0ABV0JE05_9CYAN|nr:pentapeptide repeat-containing protein [Trichocoleus sp. FACHB-46]MBD1861290.1 pentapeptide repeat-containing protein [Trichocoleus sp. FACHB-46]